MYLKMNPNTWCLVLCALILFCFVEEISSGKRKGGPHMTSKIVGGKNADIKDYPYQLQLQGLEHFCGASIISENWALTAGHCIDLWLFENIYLRAGSSIRGSGGSVHHVVEKLLSPHYDASTLNSDLALLRVDSKFSFGPGVAAVALPSQGQTTPAGLNSIVTGWGHTLYYGHPSKILQVVTVTTISDDTCKTAYEETFYLDDNSSIICAGSTDGGRDACQGDSGGPMVINGELIGVVSTGYECGDPKYPGIYARVADMRDWIKKITMV